MNTLETKEVAPNPNRKKNILVAIKTRAYEVEECEFPSYGLLMVTDNWVNLMLYRMEFIAAQKEADKNFFRVTYYDYNVDYFNDPYDALDLHFGNTDFVNMSKYHPDFLRIMPESVEESQVLVDEDSLFFRASPHHADYHFASQEISKEQLLAWKEELLG